MVVVYVVVLVVIDMVIRYFFLVMLQFRGKVRVVGLNVIVQYSDDDGVFKCCSWAIGGEVLGQFGVYICIGYVVLGGQVLLLLLLWEEWISGYSVLDL